MEWPTSISKCFQTQKESGFIQTAAWHLDTVAGIFDFLKHIRELVKSLLVGPGQNCSRLRSQSSETETNAFQTWEHCLPDCLSYLRRCRVQSDCAWNRSKSWGQMRELKEFIMWFKCFFSNLYQVSSKIYVIKDLAWNNSFIKAGEKKTNGVKPVEFPNKGKIICKINKINVTILKVCFDLAINNSKLSTAFFQMSSLTDFRGYMSVDLKHLKNRTDKPQSQGYASTVRSPWLDTTNGMTVFTELQDNGLRLHPLALMYRSSTVPIWGACSVWRNSSMTCSLQSGKNSSKTLWWH